MDINKCFDGIAKLEFTDNLVITGMKSSEDEFVPFVEKIYPIQAKVYGTDSVSMVLVTVPASFSYISVLYI